MSIENYDESSITSSEKPVITISSQPRLFPIEIIEIYPSTQNSADLKTIGKGRDGKHYAIKTIRDNNGFVPASEFFCYKLARLVSIPTPSFDHVLLNQNEVAFGSAWEGGVLSDQAQIIKMLSGDIIVEDLSHFLGRVYAFDLFVNNEDRHFGNYIFRDSFNNTKIALAFDFSRAWKETNPHGYCCLKPTCKTAICNQFIKKFNMLDKDAARETLQEISKTPSVSIEAILNEMHSTWLSEDEKSTILKWWGSEEFHSRIQKLSEAI